MIYKKESIMNEENIKELILLLPILLINLILPFLVYGKLFEVQEIYASYWIQDKFDIDLFSYYRSQFLILIGLLSIVFLLLSLNENAWKLKMQKCQIALIIYIVFVLVSTFTSIHKYFSVFGFYGRNEGGLVIFTYIILHYLSYQLVKGKYSIKVIMLSVAIPSIVIGMIGLLEFSGINIFSISPISDIILKSIPNGVTFLFDDYNIGKSMSSTFYNSNYFGSYMAILFPFSFGHYIISKNNKSTFFLGLYSCLMFSCLIGSRSRAGIIASIFAIVLFIALTHDSWMNNKKKMVIIIPFIIIFIIMNNLSNGTMLRKISTLNPEIEKSFFSNRLIPIKDMIFSGANVELIMKDQSLNINWEGNVLTFFDDSGEKMDYSRKSDYCFFFDPQYRDYTFYVNKDNNQSTLFLKIRGMSLSFYMDSNGIFFIGSNNRIYNSIPIINVLGFTNSERFGSGRGYIWSRTLPLLNDTIILGNGPDTFPLYFPQDDYIGKLNNFGKVNVVVDKPHNFYLQVAHDSGLVSLIALILFFASYFIQSLRLYLFNKSRSFTIDIGKILMCSVLGYLIAAIFNDSVVYVAPYFWILLGTGFAVNYMVKYPEESSAT